MAGWTDGWLDAWVGGWMVRVRWVDNWARGVSTPSCPSRRSGIPFVIHVLLWGIAPRHMEAN